MAISILMHVKLTATEDENVNKQRRSIFVHAST